MLMELAEPMVVFLKMRLEELLSDIYAKKIKVKYKRKGAPFKKRKILRKKYHVLAKRAMHDTHSLFAQDGELSLVANRTC
jgi:hypothetical protein